MRPTNRTLGWLLAGLSLLTACDAVDTSAFDEDENDDEVGAGPDGKADGQNGYRTGCGAPIRTGRYALRGDVVTPTEILPRGFVVIDDEKIVEIRKSSQGVPAGTKLFDTGGIIFPGLIDGHSHVEYNHIPLADLGKRYQNRDQWPNASLYQTLVKDPKNAVTAAGLKCQALKHGEARALVGGTTGIQGTPQTSCVRPLVRNIEQPNFCKDKVRQNVMGIVGYGRSISGKPSFADSIKTDIANGKLDAVVVHMAEGIDEHARSEWDMIVDHGLNTKQLVMIHSAAFTEREFKASAAVGAKMVWSPLSNLLLYGKTADVPTALKAGLEVSLGADWAPSGSANILGELKVADRVNKKLWRSSITDEQLYAMVTINPARAFGMDKEVGTIEVGKYADLLIIAKPTTGVSVYRALINARPQDVLLVTISGDPLYGTEEGMKALGKTGDYEVIDACGSKRAIDITVDAADVGGGKDSLSSIETKLKKVNPKLTPIVDCTDDEAIKAYAGTAVQ